ncbi:bromodomain adjacent to zinc finger domain protein 2B-like [Thunnus maccoyii]|uniref:bromodomain adjacent to zinc finger domain protein 2B-like n=1 Tax=Thunnus maccoyii TaxID=8240 RepID=UPI001C4D03BD|nr:bromodomain adjacent to zinc finger domain protein 2B-like [Thunnus maccoyii]
MSCDGLQPLPELFCIAGMVFPGTAFTYGLHGFWKVLGLNIPMVIPNLTTLQEGVLSQGKAKWSLRNCFWVLHCGPTICLPGQGLLRLIAEDHSHRWNSERNVLPTNLPVNMFQCEMLYVNLLT